jgi:uncharacterized membrane protein YhaH (DUF805 family)
LISSVGPIRPDLLFYLYVLVLFSFVPISTAIDKRVHALNRKRRYLAMAQIGSSIVILIFIYLMGFQGLFLLANVLILTVISFINIKQMKFCDHCNRIVSRIMGKGYPPACSHCGHPIF